MIRWCSYCQAFLGESRPYADPQLTHGICQRCIDKLDRDEPVLQQTAAPRALFERILDSARSGDAIACATMVEEARALGLSSEAVTVGLLQPALYQVGLDWQGCMLSVAAEHRFTDWCERAFEMLATELRTHEPPLDMLIFQTPGNRHTVGARFAAHALGARGRAVEAHIGELALDEMLGLVRAKRPHIVGLSCALPASIDVAVALALSLRERLGPVLQPRFVLSGMAFRLGGTPCPGPLPAGIKVVENLSDFDSLDGVERPEPAFNR
jgi:methanogenic corrinoid protein MtbC1